MEEEERKFEIAPQIESECYDNIAADFFPRILDMKSSDVLYTDESSLFDFFWMDNWEEELNACLEKIKDIYTIDLSIEDDLLLVDIFKMIENISPV